MELLKQIIGRDRNSDESVEQTRNSGKYKSVSRLDGDQMDTRDGESTYVQCINVNQNTDIIQAKDELRSGNIVIANISQLGAGQSEERVLKDLQQAVDDVNGDIAMQDTDNHIILTPGGVGISRQVL